MDYISPPVFKRIDLDGIEIDAPAPEEDVRDAAEALYMAIDTRCDQYRRGLCHETYLQENKHILGLVVNASVAELVSVLRGTMNTFEKTRDAQGYSIYGYHLNINGRKYLLETSMTFDCAVKFGFWKRLKMAMGKITNPDYIGNFYYEFKLWYKEDSYYSILIYYRTVEMKDTFYIRFLKRYLGIPEDMHHDDAPVYLRRRYEQRREYFTGNHG